MNGNSRLTHTFRALVVGVMVGCVAWSLIQLVLVFAPTWNPTYLIVGCVLAALEAYYAHNLLQTPRMRGANVLRFRVVELGLIFILLRAGRLIGKSGAEVLAEVQAWPLNPALILDLETMAAFVLVLFSWGAATATAEDLHAISIPLERRGDSVFPIRRLHGRFFGAGAALLVATGLTRLGSAAELLNLRRPPVGGLVLNVLIYFLLGWVMLGQARFVALLKQWQGQDVHVTGEVPRRWIRYSLSFIGLASLLAFVLPTGFTLGLLEIAASSLGVIGAVVYFVATLLMFILFLPVTVLFWLLAILFGSEAPPPALEFPSFEPPPPRPEGGEAGGWWQVIQALIFFVVAMVVVFYVVRSYLRDRPELRQALVALRPLQALRRGWTALWRWLKGWIARLGRTVGERMPRRLSRPPSRIKSLVAPLRFFRLGALSPRERVLYYYLSILRRAGKQGYPRRSHQTPGEYEATLQPNLPQAREEMASLTQAFVEARYSRHDVEPEQDRRVRGYFERIKAALRALKRERKSDKDVTSGLK